MKFVQRIMTSTSTKLRKIELKDYTHLFECVIVQVYIMRTLCGKLPKSTFTEQKFYFV